MKSPIELLCYLLIDFSRQHSDVKGLQRDALTLEKRFENEGYGFLTVALPSLAQAFLQGLSVGRFTCPMGFKCIHRGTIPRLFSGMFCKVFDPTTGLLLEHVDIGVFTDLYQIMMLMKKTQLSPEGEALLHAKAVDEFYHCDETASQVVIPDRHDRHIGLVCKYILPTLETKDESDALYRHGPGAVAEGVGANQKWSALISGLSQGDPDVPEWSPLHEFFQLTGPDNLAPVVRSERSGRSGVNRHHGSQTDKSTDVQSLEHRNTGLGTPSQAASLRSGSVSRLVTVAKNSTSRRTITIEPLMKMFHQQGLNTMLRDSIPECPVLGRCLALTRQELNQKLALEGSQKGNWATIDLKSASDLLSVTLVKSVFRHHPKFLGMAMDCRSTMTKSDLKSPITLGKFAGMGNALTFPVQSICFATVCIAGIIDLWGLKPTRRNVIRAASLIRVYGDDIIVDSGYAHRCVDWLQTVGLRVNVKKSFLEGNFRESCGVDAFRGVNVTPLYLRYRPEDIGESPSIIASFVALSNHLWLKGYYSASTCLREHVEAHLGVSLPLVSKDSGLLGWHSRQDASYATRWCRNTHQLMVKAFALAPVKKRDRLDGYGALLKSLLTPLLGRDIDHLSMTARRFTNRLVRRWVATRVA